MFFNKYPYTDFHELNADWLLSRMKLVLDELKAFELAKKLKFANPIEWSIIYHYDESTIVKAPNGDTYLSIKEVPAGIQLENEDYWVKIWSFDAELEAMKENYRPIDVFLKINGDDNNSGLTYDDAMKTPEAAYRKYASHKYINLLLYEPGEYDFGDGPNFGEEFIITGHDSVIAGKVPGVKLTGNIYWLSGNLELWDLTCDAYCSFRANNIVGKDVVFNGEIYNKAPFVFTDCTFNNILNFGGCNGDFRGCIFVDDTDRPKLTVSNANISFSTSMEINTSVAGAAQPFAKAYNSLVTLQTDPTYTGKYNLVLWGSASIFTLANQDIYDSIQANSVNTIGIGCYNNTQLNCSIGVSAGTRPTTVIGYLRDLNDYKDPGAYLCHPQSVNNPANAAGVLTVSRGFVNVTEQTLDVIDATEVAVYRRKYNKATDTWSSWYKFTGSPV